MRTEGGAREEREGSGEARESVVDVRDKGRLGSWQSIVIRATM